jgi:hypothetical protein
MKKKEDIENVSTKLYIFLSKNLRWEVIVDKIEIRRYSYGFVC